MEFCNVAEKILSLHSLEWLQLSSFNENTGLVLNVLKIILKTVEFSYDLGTYIRWLLPDTLIVCLFLLLYVPSQQLWSLRDGQFT